jgi:DNA repair exonuclease SbcCD ATPase subunit
MVTQRLDMAIKNFQHMNQMVERYTRLSRAYVMLAERFHQLDVEHMQLKGQMVTLLKALKGSHPRIQTLEAEKASLENALEQQAAQHRQELQALTQTYEERLAQMAGHLEELRPLAALASDDACQTLIEAEDQMELVETTLQEMEMDSTPDLNPEDKALLMAYQANPTEFLVTTMGDGEGGLPSLFVNHGDGSQPQWQPTLVESQVAEMGNV